MVFYLWHTSLFDIFLGFKSQIPLFKVVKFNLIVINGDGKDQISQFGQWVFDIMLVSNFRNWP